MDQINYQGKTWKVGHKVKVERKADNSNPNGMGARRWDNVWTPLMDRAVGNTYTIVDIDPNLGIKLRVNGVIFGFPLEVLTNPSAVDVPAPFKLEPFMRAVVRNGWQFLVVEHPMLLEGQSPAAPLYLIREDGQFAYINWPGQASPGYEHFEVTEVYAAPPYIHEILAVKKRGEILWHEGFDAQQAEKAALLKRLEQQRAELDSRINELGAQ